MYFLVEICNRSNDAIGIDAYLVFRRGKGQSIDV
jgi:hypothetical protein